MSRDTANLRGNDLLEALGINDWLLPQDHIDYIDISEAQLRVWRSGRPGEPLPVPANRVGEIKKVLERRGFFVRRPD